VWHTVVFIVVTLGLTSLQARQTPKVSQMHVATRLPLYSVMILFELILLAYVWLLGLRPAGKKLRDIIGGKWQTWGDFGIDVAIAMAFWAAVFGMLIAMHVVLGQNPQQLEAAKILIPRTIREMVLWVVLSVTAGFCEELIFRGYLQRQFLALTGRDEAAVVLQALVFGAAHLYQGWKGAVTITVYGALFGILAAWRKSLRPGMMQHAAQDTFSGIVGGIALRHHMF
jgi:CAAX protease family protein